MNAPNPHHWTLNSCFVVFPTIWVHLGPFGCLTKLGAKRAELLQKFVPRSRVGIFRNESTRSTPCDPKLMFCTIWVRLGPLSCLTKLGAKRSELVQKFVPRSRVESFRNKHTRYTPLDPKLMFRSVSYHFGLFGTIWLPYQSRNKTKSRQNFSQRTHPIHPIGP